MAFFKDFYEIYKKKSAKILILSVANSLLLILSTTIFLGKFGIAVPIFFMIGYVICNFFCERFASQLKNEISNNIRKGIYDYSINCDDFTEDYNTKITNYFAEKPKEISELYTFILKKSPFSIATLLLSLIFIFSFDARTGFITTFFLFTVAFLGLIYLKFTKKLEEDLESKLKLKREISLELERENGEIGYDINDLDSIKESVVLLKKSIANFKSCYKIGLATWTVLSFTLTVYIEAVFSNYYENTFVSANEMTFVTVILALFFMSNLVFLLVAEKYFCLKKSVLDYKKLIESLKNTEKTEEENVLFLPTGDLFFSGIYYKDKPTGKAFDGFSLRIHQGDKLAIVGGSELFSLCKNLCSYTYGEVIFCGIPTKNLPKEFLKNKVSYIFSKPKFINGTIFENIKLGNENVSDNEILNTLNLLGIDREAVDFDCDFYVENMNLKEDLLKKIAIARAIIKKPLVIFIENDVEIDINDRIFDGISVIQFCDLSNDLEKHGKIAFFSNGILTASGRYSELMENCLEFRAKVNLFDTKNQSKEGLAWQEIWKNS